MKAHSLEKQTTHSTGYLANITFLQHGAADGKMQKAAV